MRIGSVERWTDSSVVGWVRDSNGGEGPVIVRLFDSGDVIGETVAELGGDPAQGFAADEFELPLPGLAQGDGNQFRVGGFVVDQQYSCGTWRDRRRPRPRGQFGLLQVLPYQRQQRGGEQAQVGLLGQVTAGAAGAGAATRTSDRGPETAWRRR